MVITHYGGREANGSYYQRFITGESLSFSIRKNKHVGAFSSEPLFTSISKIISMSIRSSPYFTLIRTKSKLSSNST